MSQVIHGQKVFEKPTPSYYSKQQAYDIGAMCFDYGTGVSCYGNRLFQIYKGKLVDILNYPTNGFMLLSGRELWLEYDVEEFSYDQETGDITVDYSLIILDKDMVYYEDACTITYKWLDDEFEYSKESFHEILYNRLIYPTVIEGFYKDNMIGIEKFLSASDDVKEEVIYFLNTAPDCQEKDKLIRALQ